jgi:hypothetical protein
MSLIPRPLLIENWRPKTNDAASIDAFAQIMRGQVLEIERRKFGEMRKDERSKCRDSRPHSPDRAAAKRRLLVAIGVTH